jgi:hypothetical protein
MATELENMRRQIAVLREATANTARIAHEMNRRWCELTGDNSQPAWEDAPQWQRDSAIAGVTFHLENPSAGPSASHESWLAVKAAEGWKYGPAKDPEKREHPCCIPYSELPALQKAKDAIFVAVVHGRSHG